MSGRRGPMGRLTIVVVGAALTVMSCGSPDPESGPDPDGGAGTQDRLDGVFLLSALTVEGNDRFLGTPAVFEIDGEFASLEIDTGCGTHFGSFSLFADGAAGVTIAGGSMEQCDAVQAEQERLLFELLAEVDQWSTEGAVVQLSTPSGDWLSMTR